MHPKLFKKYIKNLKDKCANNTSDVSINMHAMFMCAECCVDSLELIYELTADSDVLELIRAWSKIMGLLKICDPSDPAVVQECMDLCHALCVTTADKVQQFPPDLGIQQFGGS